MTCEHCSQEHCASVLLGSTCRVHEPTGTRPQYSLAYYTNQKVTSKISALGIPWGPTPLRCLVLTTSAGVETHAEVKPAHPDAATSHANPELMLGRAHCSYCSCHCHPEISTCASKPLPSWASKRDLASS
eukprot:4972023-Amphidinium_carterae.2